MNTNSNNFVFTDNCLLYFLLCSYIEAYTCIYLKLACGLCTVHLCHQLFKSKGFSFQKHVCKLCDLSKSSNNQSLLTCLHLFFFWSSLKCKWKWDTSCKHGHNLWLQACFLNASHLHLKNKSESFSKPCPECLGLLVNCTKLWCNIAEVKLI